MSKTLSFGKFVVVGLVCYFGYILIRAHDNLQDKKIGTAFQKIREKTVQESPLFSSLVTEYGSNFQTTLHCVCIDDENRESLIGLVPTSNGMHLQG